MRLLRRNRDPSSLSEVDCYSHVYEDGFPGHVDPVPTTPPNPVVEIEWEDEPPGHVTTEGLKRAFEERLAARKHRRRH